ncbi:hypothetical protein BIV23_17945 [Streptomyces monashensis]|uniref:Uncharacterized protein n=1 Tax=Streptomyces monashensis TaxID=1678012 RepID=A0A1S2QE01_9ACTN|nr:hypothetical protein BIV23_17945 [Streptomyces monashensis]
MAATDLPVGSLFSRVGDLDLGVQAALGGHIAWHAETDSQAAAHPLAIRGWEHVTQRAAPRLTVDGTRWLSAEFGALMMGPAGWVTKTDSLSRVAQLHLLGNAAVPRQTTQLTAFCPSTILRSRASPRWETSGECLAIGFHRRTWSWPSAAVFAGQTGGT